MLFTKFGLMSSLESRGRILNADLKIPILIVEALLQWKGKNLLVYEKWKKGTLFYCNR